MCIWICGGEKKVVLPFYLTKGFCSDTYLSSNLNPLEVLGFNALNFILDLILPEKLSLSMEVMLRA